MGIAAAKEMLRAELKKQPALSIFYSAEGWVLALVPALVEAGYLGPAREMATAAGACTVNDVTDLARAELM